MTALPAPPAHDGSPRATLIDLFQTALAAVDPLRVLAAHLPARPKGRTVVVGAGKASARMALALERAWDGPLEGLVVTRYGHGEPCERIRIVEAGHPVPDEAGVQAASQIMALVRGLGPDDLVIALMSGGGSSLLAAPANGLTLQDKRDTTLALLRCGASISEINCVRKHLSSVKGGKLAAACGMARVMTLVVSDVPGDDPAVVASGPTLESPSTAQDALALLDRYAVRPPLRVYAALKLGLNVPAAVPAGPRDCKVIATAQLALDAAADRARSLGIMPLILGNAIEGEARHVGVVHAGIARQIVQHGQPLQGPAVILSGGETTVTVTGQGRGGRNAEFLLAHALAVRDLPTVWGLAADTDGIDGSEDNAGAVFGPDTWARAHSLGLLASNFLGSNDAFSFFEATGDLLTTGPTRTNVNDFRATLAL